MGDDDAVTAAKLMTHEAVCAERYKNLVDRMLSMDASLNEVKGFIFRGVFGIGAVVLTACGWLIVHYVLSK